MTKYYKKLNKEGEVVQILCIDSTNKEDNVEMESFSNYNDELDNNKELIEIELDEYKEILIKKQAFSGLKFDNPKPDRV